MMHAEIRENYEEKLRLVVVDLIEKLDNDIQIMLAEHSAKGLLHSGNTIKRTMEFIAEGSASLYEVIILHLQSLDMTYYPTIEHEIQELADTAQRSFKSEVLSRFKKSTELAGRPNLYDRMLPEVEAGMASDLAKFQNELNASTVKLKLSNNMSPLTKVLWGFEVLFLLASMFIAGMWFKDPSGNYEPILVGLGLAVPLIAVGIKIDARKVT